jgi:multidrug efflux pump subunit AcrA (membrane-fusion protein)
MEQLSNCSSFTQSNVGQKLVIMLDGSTSNKDYAQRNIQRSFQTPMIGVNIPPSRISSTSISVRKTMQKVPRNNNVIRRQETISGNHTTHIQKSTHRVERFSSKIKEQQRRQQQQLQQRQQQLQKRQLQQKQLQKQLQKQRQKQQKQRQQQQQQTTSRSRQYKKRTLKQGRMPRKSRADDEYSDDDSDSRKVDLELLKLVKKKLRNYINELPSRKLKSGEYTWSEIKPYIREIHHPRFKKYLLNRGIQASNAMIIRCLKDLHISRRDLWLKKQRQLREQRSKEQIDNAEPQSPRSDGYVAFIPRVVIYN